MNRSPTVDALMACVRFEAPASGPGSVGDVLRGVTDWQQLADAAAHHGIVGLVCRRVADECPGAIPSATLASMRQIAAAIAHRSLRMQRQLLALLDRLSAAGVPALSFKGPAFAQQLYGDSTLRYFCDLDLLIRTDHVAAARRIARAVGFEEKYPIDVVPESVLQAGDQEIGLTRPTTGLDVDIHWQIGPRFSADSLKAEDLFARAERIELLGREVLALGPLDAVLVAAVHATSHDWTRLEDVAAVNAGISRLTPAEWDEVEALATTSGCRRRLHVAALVASRASGSHLPSVVMTNALADRRARLLARSAASRLLRSLDGTSVPGWRPRIVWQALTLDTSTAALANLWRKLLTPSIIDWDRGDESAPGSGRRIAAMTRRYVRLLRG